MANASASWAVQALERAGKSVVQGFAVALLALGVYNFVSVEHAVYIGLGAGVVSILTSVLSVPVSKNLSFWPDAFLRSALTFVQTIASIVGLNAFDVTSVNWVHIFTVAAVAALTSLLTSMASHSVGPPVSPSTV